MKIPNSNQHILFGGIFILANKLKHVAEQKVEGLSVKQWFLLRTLQDMPIEPAPTITSLAKETDTTRQNTTKMLEILHRNGYVVIADNPCDGRSSKIEITEQGLQMLGTMAAGSARFFHELFTDIDDKDLAIAAEVIIKIIEKLSKMQEEMP